MYTYFFITNTCRCAYGLERGTDTRFRLLNVFYYTCTRRAVWYTTLLFYICVQCGKLLIGLNTIEIKIKFILFFGQIQTTEYGNVQRNNI